jgi:glycosyltransferase involved in cell wall biosynthesis
MKVLHLSSDYYLSPIYENLILSLQENKVENEVFTLALKEVNVKSKAQWKIVGLTDCFTLLDRLLFFGKQRTIFSNILKNFSTDEFNIIHAHTLFSAGYAAYLLNKKYNIPYIVVIRNTDLNIFFKYMVHLRCFGRKIIYNAQKIVFLSSSYRDFLVDKYIPIRKKQNVLDKTLIIPNGIDQFFFDNRLHIKKNVSKDIIRLIYIGEVNKNKNIVATIKACKDLIKRGYKVTYTIVGEIASPYYRRTIEKHKFINYHVRCLKEELIHLLRDSDIFVMPSVHESFGLVYAEAMSQGLPIIYSKGQGFDRQFREGTVGYAVQSFDYKNISNKIIEIWNNYAHFSDNCLTLVDKFNWLKIAEAYKKAYEKPI